VEFTKYLEEKDRTFQIVFVFLDFRSKNVVFVV